MLNEPATRERVSLRLMIVLSSLFFGVAVTEATSVYVLPRTLNFFTENPQYIFLVLAINPAFGFIAQPLVGMWSDRIWTPVGRRGFFLVSCAPVVALSLAFLPWAATFLQVILLVVVLQFFQDMLNGSDQPLLADLVPPEQRTFMLGLVKTFENLGFLFVLMLGMRWVGAHAKVHGGAQYGFPMYVVAAVCQLIFVMAAAFFLGEKKPAAPPERSSLTPARYLRDFLEQPMLLRIAVAYFLRSFARTAVVGSVALYAARTLAFSEEELGSSWGLMPFIALVLGVPLGLLAERFAKHRVLQAAFFALVVGCVIGYLAGRPAGLAAAAFCFGFGDMLLEVTHKAFMSEFYPADIIGQLAGAVNVFYATGRTAALVFVGYCVKWYNPDVDWNQLGEDGFVDYHVIWIIAAGAALLGIAVLSTVRDFRHEQRSGVITPATE